MLFRHFVHRSGISRAIRFRGQIGHQFAGLLKESTYCVMLDAALSGDQQAAASAISAAPEIEITALGALVSA